MPTDMPRDILIEPTQDELRAAYACTDLMDCGITFDHAARVGQALGVALRRLALILRRRRARQANAAAIQYQTQETP
ncbi:MAG TPA: hypothetical protein P5038_21290 [Candidatus Paceibacterota bacterium]|nr:hypothetical protein [Candidatus Paceibacterota bacterium]